ncbi:unnamed protein product, partial [Ectocarpus fasciculatus]
MHAYHTTTPQPSVELLRWAEATVKGRSGGENDAVFARWFDAQGEVSETHTFASVWAEAGRIAHELRVSWGLGKGDRAILCYGFGLDFFAAFLGCLRAGVLAVPVYPPSPLTLSKSLAKLQGTVEACDPKVILISADVNRLRLASKLNFVSSARRLWPDLPYKLKIVDPETRREVALGEVGELWLSSPSVAAGYWGKPELTEEAFNARVVGEEQGEGSDSPTGTVFLRTGDLARLESGGSGRLFISGRIKDLIIVRGRNLYPQDVEFAVQEASSIVRPGCVAAFSTTELGGELEVVLEVRKSAEGDPDGLCEGLEAVRRAIAAEGCYPSRVVAIKEKTIPKTTSGKIQRRRSREMLHQGALSVITELTA